MEDNKPEETQEVQNEVKMAEETAENNNQNIPNEEPQNTEEQNQPEEQKKEPSKPKKNVILKLVEDSMDSIGKSLETEVN
ncbi:MAG: hypothetical protein MJ252_20640 [archaeon]|nr:hypothetical protein [archaeon]